MSFTIGLLALLACRDEPGVEPRRPRPAPETPTDTGTAPTPTTPTVPSTPIDTAVPELWPPWASFGVDSPDQAFLMPVLFDYDNDGALDVVAGTVDQGGYLWRVPEQGGLTLGTLEAERIDLVGPKLAVVDIDRDGDLDLVSSLGTIFGTFVEIVFAPVGAGGRFAWGTLTDNFVCLADFDGDGYVDVSTGASSLLVVSYGPFSPTATQPPRESRISVYGPDYAGDAVNAQCVDINGDGFMDVVTDNANSILTEQDHVIAFLGPFDPNVAEVSPLPLGIDVPPIADLHAIAGASGEARYLAIAAEQRDGLDYLHWYALPLDVLDPKPAARYPLPESRDVWDVEISSAGDLNGDGVEETMVVRTSMHRLEWVVLASPYEGVPVVVDSGESDFDNDNILRMAAAGDVDGDGVSDWLWLRGVYALYPRAEVHLRGKVVP